jgi:hypothetical protein
MIGFSRPAIQSASHVAFRNTESAVAWLEARSQTGAADLLSALQAEIDAFNRCELSSRERLKTLEVLRKTVFSVSDDCRRLFAEKPLPLAADERAALDAARRLWRSYAAGYQYCLQACLEGNSSLSRYGARMAHRFACCLRAEQMTCYAGGMALKAGFWKSFHTLFLAAERLGCAEETMEERLLLGETRMSSVSGQYAMALMLHLAWPFSLSGKQLAAAVRWLARWREQTRILGQTEIDAESGSLLVPLDLASDGPVHEGGGEARLPRWLSLGSAQSKLRQRFEALAAGESPESLKLGDSLSAEDCAALLETLMNHLQRPPLAVSADTGGMPRLPVGVGLAAIHRLLGGKGLEEAPHPGEDPPDGERPGEAKSAVFRQVAREAPSARAAPESWRLARRERDEWLLLRPPGKGDSRLSLHGLLAVRMREYALTLITGLWQNDDGILYCTVRPLAGEAVPRIAEIRNWVTGKVVRHPAFQLPANEERARDLLLLPAGVLVRSSGVRFLDGDGELLMGLRVADCLERGSEVDFWRAASND